MAGQLGRGSVWQRWDPHIHTPGTILADQYPAADGWEQFLTRIETSEPRVRALGITDYYSTATYEQALAYKAAGRMPDVDLIFPNVELRLGVGTDKGSPVNLHLLVSPDDDDHLTRLHAFLSDLRFEAKDERYRCTAADIMRLGRVHDANATSDQRALEVGTNQFKVDLANLREAMKASPWARENILVAVPASNKDGTAGLQGDSSLERLRREIERAAQIIFSGRPADRQFWLGKTPVGRETLVSEYGGLKPCLHGSDAHRPETVAAPAQDRRCWLKGRVTFETLRQACLEPEMRVFVGTAAPPAAQPSQVMTEVEVKGAPFLLDAVVPLNPGLIGIIGARGSGKTALADLIAAGGSALSLKANKLSFVYRARDHLAGAQVDLSWDDGSGCGETIANLLEREGESDEPQVRYLSQQFVDRLCSAEGLTDELLNEIQRVIFLAHPTEERLGATDFGQLLDLRAESARTARGQAEDELRDLSTEFVSEREKEASVVPLRAKLTTLQGTIAKAQADRTALVGKSGGDQARLNTYNVVAAALQKRRSEHEQLERRRNGLDTLAREVLLAKTRTFPDALRQMRQRHEAAQMPEALWPRFEFKFAGDVDGAIAGERAAVVAALTALAGTPIPIVTAAPPAKTSYLPQDAPLGTLSIAILAAEAQRLEALIGVDRAAAKALTALNSKIAVDEGQAANLQRQIETAEKAPARLLAIRDERRAAYTRVFDAIVCEQAELTSLYAPLATRIDAETGSARKLSFEVRRRVDVEAWARKGEALLDLRKGSKLRKGSLADLARAALLPAWSGGTAEEVSTALAGFREAHDAAIIECCPYNRRDPAEAADYRQWAGDVSAWLYGTDHIQIAYGIQYDGTDVERLSPGTRGIVLLLLYLAIDTDDDRPLIIDQPEENLDPRSIFVELVERFRSTKQRRQIIIVTHNANLIVNTDADQVIVATCGPHRPGQLPEIRYQSGGL
ncbi:AAA family ATPase [Sphingomonas sp. 2R-10]|nr:AAA family ATPase [Sphingomonas sp. 2R-10]MDJ0276087.1 AAA family ATPase [Sphingomonas sp. 2R-10]